jgi:MoxR-like ATPase
MTLCLPDQLTLPDGAGYLLPKEAREALEFAWACDRPLLVLGEAGIGKTDLARAVAHFKNWELLVHTMLSTSSSQDLLWAIDHVKRLATAQMQSITKQKARSNNPLLLKNFITEGVLYKALGANGQERKMSSVVLIDEIDKAPHDVPNNLLDVLDNKSFALPDFTEFTAPSSAPKNLIILTSNREKSLPKAFLRRCVVLLLKVEEDKYEDWLVQRAKVHFGSNAPDPRVLQAAAKATLKQRAEQSKYKAGTSEFLDIIKAARDYAPQDVNEQIELIDRFAKYIYKDAAIIG